MENFILCAVWNKKKSIITSSYFLDIKQEKEENA